MSNQTLSNQVLALAGIAQACALVEELATTGNVNPLAFECSVNSVLKLDADSVLDVFGGTAGIEYGLQQLRAQLSGELKHKPHLSRYAAQLVFLQAEMAKRDDMQAMIRTGIVKAQAQSEHFGAVHSNVLANLADVYSNTLSKLHPRIMIIGDQHHLGDQTSVNKIRTLLLAGIRASMLWRQCGGRRWHLLFKRKPLEAEIERLLARY